jgi:hypothetical protein
MLFVDAGNNKVGIGESSPVALMDIGGAQSDQSLMLRSGDNNSASSGGKQILFGFNNSASYSHNIRTRHDSANQTNNTIAFYTWQPTQSAGDYGNARIADFSSSGVVFNEDSRDADFRVESNSNTHAFFVDAGAERIGIFENSPQQGVTLGGGNVFEYRSGSQAMFRPSNNSNDHRIRALSTSGMDVVWGGATNTSMQRWKNGDAVVFNEDSANQDFRVESDSDTHAFFVDAGASRVNMGTSGSLQSASTASNGWTWQGNYMVSCSNADTACILNRTSSVGSIAQFRYNGAGKGGIDISTSGTTYNTTSDIRLKTDINPIADATDKLMAMNPVSHRWKADPDADAVYGFIAQEMQDIVPEAVSGDPEGEEMMSMDYGRITPVLVAALQEATNEIKALKQRVSELEAK